MRKISWVKEYLTIVSCSLALGVMSFKSHAIAHDPTRPVNMSSGSNSQIPIGIYELKSIIIGKGRRLALINDKFVGVGDSIGGAKVINIDRNSVVILEAGQRRTIHLFDRSIWK